MKRPPAWLTPRRSRNESAYPLTPVSGPAEPSGQPVHFVVSAMGWARAACGVSSVYQRLHTRYPGCVTCPDCLKKISPASSQPLPYGSPAGGTSLSAGLAFDSAKKPIFTTHDTSLLVVVPGPLSAGSGIF